MPTEQEPFVLMSLKDDKAKKLANVLNNKSSAKILNYLANHGNDEDGVTESKIAKDLKLPLSTVNYNMKALVEAKLVLADEYHYSEKGREVNHYRLARKYIIIAPEEEKEGFLDRIKKYIPVALVAAGAGVLIRLLSILTGTFSMAGSSLGTKQADFVACAAPEAAAEAMRTTLGGAAKVAVDSAVAAGGGVVADAANEMVAEAANKTLAEGVNEAAVETMAASAPAAGAAVPAAVPAAAPTAAALPPPPTAAHEHSFLSLIMGDWLGWFLLGIFVFVLVAMLIEYLRGRKK